MRASCRRGVTTPQRPIDHATGAEPRGTPKRASGFRALTSRLRCRLHLQHYGGRRPQLHTGERAMESRGARRESFMPSWSHTMPPLLSHRCRASRYSQASIGIMCYHLTAAMQPPPAALRRPPPAAAHGWAGNGVVRGAAWELHPAWSHNAPHHHANRCKASRYSRVSIEITCANLTAAMPPPPAALRRPPPAAAHW